MYAILDISATPPGFEDWVKARKPEFRKRYGKKYKAILYGRAWNMHKKGIKPKPHTP